MEETKKERVKPIRVTDVETGREYILDFSRETIKNAEAHGFSWPKAQEYPFTYLPMIWYAAFLMHEPRMNPALAQRFFDDANGIQEAQLTRLRELYEQCGDTLIADATEDGNTKNSKVAVILD